LCRHIILRYQTFCVFLQWREAEALRGEEPNAVMIDGEPLQVIKAVNCHAY